MVCLSAKIVVEYIGIAKQRSASMEKHIRKLMSQETLNGAETGRLMILDLLSAYKDLLCGGDGTGFMSDAEKIELVNRLTSSEDISRFNDFKGVHDYLTTFSAIFDSFAKTYEVCHWKLHHFLDDMKYSEEESAFSKTLPVIMTEKQYEKFTSSGSALPPGGVAVLREIPGIEAVTDENGFYITREPEWRGIYSAENILSTHSDFIQETLNTMKDTLAECLARQKALELIGRFIKVPHVKILISPVDEGKIQLLNDYMASTIEGIRREDCNYEQEIKQKLSALFEPIDLTVLSPAAVAVTKARRALNFDVIKNGSEAFTSALKREWRDACSE